MVRAATRPLTLITGATSGIGRAAAGMLAARGHRLILVGRDPVRTELTFRQIEAQVPGAQTHALRCDFSKPKEIHDLAKEVVRLFGGLDVLVNNAGVVCPEYSETAGGVETTFAVNHLGYFLLTGLLWDALPPGARVVNVASKAHMHGQIHWDNLNLRGDYGYYKAYAQSKLANLHFTFSLSERALSKNMTVNVLHPGVVATNIWPRHKPLLRRVIDFAKPWMSTPEQGARTVVYLADDPQAGRLNGEYLEHCKVVVPASKARDAQAAQRLWALSEHLCDFAWPSS
ncbi:MAG: SDR family NAD(P)-dependent oxidoreductase [Planctomycetes bacterium]|nr:SDR family NAD(P)-dependent oxidoreductase [Planctomycetota bacterium]